MFFHGDLNKLYLEPDEAIDDETTAENNKLHDKFNAFVADENKKNEYKRDGYDDYYDEEYWVIEIMHIFI